MIDVTVALSMPDGRSGSCVVSPEEAVQLLAYVAKNLPFIKAGIVPDAGEEVST